MSVNKERVELFVAALESDGYRQCRTTLKLELAGTPVQHCALGVATEVALLHEPSLDKRYVWNLPFLHNQVAAWYGFSDGMVSLPNWHAHSSGPDWVGAWNDAGASFWEIAQAIRAEYLKDAT